MRREEIRDLGVRASFGALALTLLSPALFAQADPAANATPGGGGAQTTVGGGGVNALDFTPGSGSCGNNAVQMIGWQFDVINDVTVSAMSWFDDNLDGLPLAHEVGIWAPGGVLIASTHVTIPAGTAATLDGIWRTVDIAPTLLPAGIGYVVGGLNGPTSQCLSFNVSQTVHPDISFFDATFQGFGGAFIRPDLFSSAVNGFYGVGFQVGPGGTPQTAYCFGDGSGTPCPCGNTSTPGAGEGCVNSTGNGSVLVADGSVSVGADDLTFQASQLVPNEPALLFAALNQINGGNGIVFGDGLRCAGTNIIRLGVVTADAGGGGAWGPGLAAQGGWSGGDTRRFQVWSRDPGAGSPCGQFFNLSHGLELNFVN